MAGEGFNASRQYTKPTPRQYEMPRRVSMQRASIAACVRERRVGRSWKLSGLSRGVVQAGGVNGAQSISPLWGDCLCSVGPTGGGQPPHLPLKWPEAGRGLPERNSSPDPPRAACAPGPPSIPTDEGGVGSREVSGKSFIGRGLRRVVIPLGPPQCAHQGPS